MASDAAQDKVWRLLDANANRAREGIRTAEDFTRFVLGEGPWASELQRLRRQVTEILHGHFPAEMLTAARRVAQDSGRPGRAGLEESPRPDEKPQAVALRGLKRAQEAVRVLEEYTRGRRPAASRLLAHVRYRLYEAEQWLCVGGERCRRLRAAQLYVLLTEALCRRGWAATARAALKGGAQIVQLREKFEEGSALLYKAKLLRELCDKHDALLIVNDRADIAQAANADGVHLGQTDLPPEAVRPWAGEGLLIGRSTHALVQAERAVRQEGVDYLAVGSMYETATQPGRILAGPELARAVCARDWGIPVFAIGGLTAERVRNLRRLGVTRIAVSSAVVSAPDPERAAREILEALNGGRDGMKAVARTKRRSGSRS